MAWVNSELLDEYIQGLLGSFYSNLSYKREFTHTVDDLRKIYSKMNPSDKKKAFNYFRKFVSSDPKYRKYKDIPYEDFDTDFFDGWLYGGRFGNFVLKSESEKLKQEIQYRKEQNKKYAEERIQKKKDQARLINKLQSKPILQRFEDIVKEYDYWFGDRGTFEDYKIYRSMHDQANALYKEMNYENKLKAKDIFNKYSDKFNSEIKM